MAKGTLYLVPTTLGKTPLNNSIPEHTLSVLRSLDSLVVENIQTSVKFLHWVGDTIPEYKIDFYHLNKNTPDLEIFSFLKPLKAGKNLGLLSEAGVPAVAELTVNTPLRRERLFSLKGNLADIIEHRFLWRLRIVITKCLKPSWIPQAMKLVFVQLPTSP